MKSHISWGEGYKIPYKGNGGHNRQFGEQRVGTNSTRARSLGLGCGVGKGRKVLRVTSTVVEFGLVNSGQCQEVVCACI